MSLSGYKTHERAIHFSHCFKHLTAKVWLDSFWPQAGTRSEGPSKLELSQFPEGPVTTCDLVPTPTSGLGIVQALEQVTRAGRVQCLPASLQWLYLPEGEIKVSKVYWSACCDLVGRQRMGNKTSFLASFPRHTTLRGLDWKPRIHLREFDQKMDDGWF